MKYIVNFVHFSKPQFQHNGQISGNYLIFWGELLKLVLAFLKKSVLDIFPGMVYMLL